MIPAAFLFIAIIAAIGYIIYGTDRLQHPTKRELNRYRKIKGCKEFGQQFEKDKASNELKFFMYGLLDERGVKFITNIGKKYNITIFSLGCVRTEQFDCYNYKVNEYLIKEFADSSLFEIVY